jgi:hypothetical protein
LPSRKRNQQSIQRELNSPLDHGKVACSHNTLDASRQIELSKNRRDRRPEARGRRSERGDIGLQLPTSGLRPLTSSPVGLVRVELTTSCLRGRCNCLSASTPRISHRPESPHGRPGNRTRRDMLIRLVRSTRPSSPSLSCRCHGSGAIRTLINSLKRRVCYPLTPRSRSRFRVCV